MNPKLRAFLEANGLRADATEAEAWEYKKQLEAGGIAFIGPERAEVAPPAATPAQVMVAQPSAPVIDQAAIDRALAADRQRAADIEDVCGHVGMDATAIRQLVVSGASVDAARKAAIDHLKATSKPFGPGTGQAQVGVEDRDKMRSAAIDGMLLRCGHRLEKPAPGAREFRGMRLLDIVRESLEVAGERTRGLDPRALVGRALAPASTSDFASLLGALVNKTLLAAYTEAPATWRPLVAVSDAVDFKTKYAIKLSGAPDLATLRENGEYQTADLSDSKESYAVSTKGRIIYLTRQMIINDDLGGFNRIAQMFGAAARRFENATVYGLVTANANMSDGNALFSSAHNNTLTAAALAADSLALARAKMRRQTGAKSEKLDVTPAFLVAGPELETAAEVLLRSAAYPVSGYSGGVVNPAWIGRLQAITDPLISDTNAWYLFASPSQYPVIEVAWLMGEEQPYIEEETVFNTDALGIKVRHDFGAGVVDYVGAVYNEGA